MNCVKNQNKQQKKKKDNKWWPRVFTWKEIFNEVTWKIVKSFIVQLIRTDWYIMVF